MPHPAATLRLVLAVTLAALAGACVDGTTNKWVDPVTFGGMAAQGAARSRPAPPPPAEYEALCKTGFPVQRAGPLAPDGLAVDGSPATVALALRRAGAAYAVIHVNEDGWGKAFRPLIATPGVYRIRRAGPATPDCDRLLDEIIRAWSESARPWAKAGACLTAERVGPYTPFDPRQGSPAAPYFIRPINETQALPGGFSLNISGQAVVARDSGREVARQTRRAFLQWAEPDRDHLYWGAIRTCGPDANMGPQHGILDERLFGAP